MHCTMYIISLDSLRLFLFLSQTNIVCQPALETHMFSIAKVFRKKMGENIFTQKFWIIVERYRNWWNVWWVGMMARGNIVVCIWCTHVCSIFCFLEKKTSLLWVVTSFFGNDMLIFLKKIFKIQTLDKKMMLDLSVNFTCILNFWITQKYNILTFNMSG